MTGKIFRRISTAWFAGFFTMLVVFLLFAMPTAACAEEITYTGDKKQLQKMPSLFTVTYLQVLFPGTEAALLASDNKMTVNYNPAATDAVNPNFVFGGLSESENVTGNRIILLNGYIDYHVQGGFSLNGNVVSNDVHISGGTVGCCVSGGVSVKGSSTGNTVTISGGTVNRDIYGGYTDEAGNVINNTVTISGKPNLSNSYIYGGFSAYTSEDDFTGNTFNLKSSGITAKGVSNFEYYNFYLPEGLEDSGVMLSVIETVNLEGATVAIFLQGSVKLSEGDMIALIKSAGGVSNAPKNESCQARQDGALYEFSIYTDKNNLWAKVEKINVAAK